MGCCPARGRLPSRTGPSHLKEAAACRSAPRRPGPAPGGAASRPPLVGAGSGGLPLIPLPEESRITAGLPPGNAMEAVAAAPQPCGGDSSRRRAAQVESARRGVLVPATLAPCAGMYRCVLPGALPSWTSAVLMLIDFPAAALRSRILKYFCYCMFFNKVHKSWLRCGACG